MGTIYQNNKEIIYVSQDNYYIADLTGKNVVYYCDSATSCIVIISIGFSKDNGKEIALISHLSRPGRFEKYFSMVETLFTGAVTIYASGANPSNDDTAVRNAKQVSKWVESGRVQVKQASLKFGQGNPAIYTNNLDCYSLSCDETGNYRVSNDRVYLTNEQRDPTGGVQTLFCVYADPAEIRDQKENFTESEIAELVKCAHDKNLEQAAEMTNEQILSTYSSTPEYEVSWFCDTIRQAGLFVKNYRKGV